MVEEQTRGVWDAVFAEVSQLRDESSTTVTYGLDNVHSSTCYLHVITSVLCLTSIINNFLRSDALATNATKQSMLIPILRVTYENTN